MAWSAPAAAASKAHWRSARSGARRTSAALSSSDAGKAPVAYERTPLARPWRAAPKSGRAASSPDAFTTPKDAAEAADADSGGSASVLSQRAALVGSVCAGAERRRHDAAHASAVGAAAEHAAASTPRKPGTPPPSPLLGAAADEGDTALPPSVEPPTTKVRSARSTVLECSSVCADASSGAQRTRVMPVTAPANPAIAASSAIRSSQRAPRKAPCHSAQQLASAAPSTAGRAARRPVPGCACAPSSFAALTVSQPHRKHRVAPAVTEKATVATASGACGGGDDEASAASSAVSASSASRSLAAAAWLTSEAISTASADALDSRSCCATAMALSTSTRSCVILAR